jgi:pre-mRNA-splicing factor 38B
MKLLLDHADSPYIRGVGFLYLRYVCDPKVVWSWVEPYLYDEEVVQVAASAKQPSETIGSFVRRLFTDRNYSGTMLPRLPIQMERDIQVKLLEAEKMEERAQKHANNPRTMAYFEKLGAKVMALYGDEENPIQWYEGVVDRVITTSEETGQPLKKPKFIVTFPEYGNTETVSVGEMEMPGMASGLLKEPRRDGPADERRQAPAGRRDERGYEDRGRGYGNKDFDRNDDRGYGGRNNDRGYGSHSRDRGHGDGDGGNLRGREPVGRGRDDRRWERGNSNSGRSSHVSAALPTQDELYEEVRRRERETVTANKRSAVSRRPPTMKSQLELPREGRRRSASPENFVPKGNRTSSQVASYDDAPEQRKRSADEIAAIQDKKRRLMAKYG